MDDFVLNISNLLICYQIQMALEILCNTCDLFGMEIASNLFLFFQTLFAVGVFCFHKIPISTVMSI